LTGALHVLQLQLSPLTTSTTLSSNKIQDGDILVPANTDPPEKCPLKWRQMGMWKTNLRVPFMLCLCRLVFFRIIQPSAGFGVVRIDPLRFLAGCRTRRLNQVLSVLSLSLDVFSISVVLLTRASFWVVLFVCSVPWLFLLGCQYQCK